jgi:hypothetical protein
LRIIIEFPHKNKSLLGVASEANLNDIGKGGKILFVAYKQLRRRILRILDWVFSKYLTRENKAASQSSV